MSGHSGLFVGVVKNNSDPAQHGRLQIYIPSIDSDSFNTGDLPWATYVSPFGGATANAKVGRSADTVSGVSAYGFWAIPQVGSQVLCGFINGNHTMRVYFGCLHMPQLNRTVPQALNGVSTEIDESGQYPQAKISYLVNNLTTAGLAPGQPNYQTRGWERSISYPSNGDAAKNTSNGYGAKSLDSTSAESQMVALTTPGRHYFLMSDVAEQCRVRLRTTAGSQVIFDDTNERIYVSTAKGTNYIELDETNGKIYVYSNSKVNIRAKNDINLYSDNNINIVAKKRVNIQSETRGVKIQANNTIQMLSAGGDLAFTAGCGITLKTTGGSAAPAVGGGTSSFPGGVGLVRDFAEPAGSGSSTIKVDSKDGVQLTTQGSFAANASNSISFNTSGSLSFVSSSGSALNLGGGSTTMSSSTPINLKTPAFNVDTPSFGFKAVDPESGLLPIQSTTAVSTNSPSQPVITSATAASSDSIASFMVRPDHESWVRDEDEAQCKTPRNPLWKP